jgi:uncharacterized protein YjbI with pentapeptide repeats
LTACTTYGDYSAMPREAWHRRWFGRRREGSATPRDDVSGCEDNGYDETLPEQGRCASDAVRPDVVVRRGADLSNRNLSGRNFRNADLKGADLHGSDLSNCDFSGADLRNADLSHTVLLGSRLIVGPNVAGANLDHAVIEDARYSFPDLDNAKEAAKALTSLLLSTTVLAAYAVLAVMNLSDAAMLTNAGLLKLPIIDTTIPITSFFQLAPIVLLGAHLYLRAMLVRLTAILGRLPAVFRDGRTLEEALYPWVAFTVVPRTSFHRAHRPLSSKLTALFVRWLVPFCLCLFWLRYLPSRTVGTTVVHIAATAIAIATTSRPTSGDASDVPVYSRMHPAVRRLRRLVSPLVFAAAAAALAVLTWGAFAGEYPIVDLRTEAGSFGSVTWFHVKEPPMNTFRGLIPQVLAVGGFSPVAVLSDEQLSVKPPGWDAAPGGSVASVMGANFAGRDLAYVRFERSFLARADFRGAIVDHTNFNYADLRGADFGIFGRYFTGSLIGFDANLFFIGIRRSTSLGNSSIVNSRFVGADLRGANFAGRPAIENSEFVGADLRNASLSGVAIRSSSFIGADLRGVRLDETLDDVLLHGARLEAADLRRAEISERALAVACVDASTLLPPGRRGRDCRRPLERWEVLALAALDCRRENGRYADDCVRRTDDFVARVVDSAESIPVPAPEPMSTLHRGSSDDAREMLQPDRTGTFTVIAAPKSDVSQSVCLPLRSRDWQIRKGSLRLVQEEPLPKEQHLWGHTVQETESGYCYSVQKRTGANDAPEEFRFHLQYTLVRRR